MLLEVVFFLVISWSKDAVSCELVGDLRALGSAAETPLDALSVSVLDLCPWVSAVWLARVALSWWAEAEVTKRHDQVGIEI